MRNMHGITMRPKARVLATAGGCLLLVGLLALLYSADHLRDYTAAPDFVVTSAFPEFTIISISTSPQISPSTQPSPSPQTSPSPPTTSPAIATARPVHPCVKANITVVSAFFDIGSYKWRKGKRHRTVQEYLPWSLALAYLHTPLVFYTDTHVFADHVTKLRARLPAKFTRVYKVHRSQLWPFNLRDPIAALYSRKDYPKHHPNTVVPEYSCAQHSKYAAILDLILHKPDVISTEVYVWLDFGYFREVDDKKEYCLVLPERFSTSTVFYNQVKQPNFAQSARSVFYDNQVWVGGGMFLATRRTMVKFCMEYQRSVEFWLFQRNLSSTDQQNLYASFTKEGLTEVNFSVPLQVGKGTHNWFELGNSCLHKLTNETVLEVDKGFQH